MSLAVIREQVVLQVYRAPDAPLVLVPSTTTLQITTDSAASEDGGLVLIKTATIGPMGPAGADSTVPGPTGPAGLDGNTILSGSPDPDDLLDGVDGDFYLQDKHWLYGPKAGGAWPFPPDSIQGIQGNAGIQGVQGNPGTNGTNGTNGQGVPTGGTSSPRQYLAKNSGTDYDTLWRQMVSTDLSDSSSLVRTTNNLSDLSDADAARANLNMMWLKPATVGALNNVSSKSGTGSLDSQAYAVGDIVLLTAQTTPSENGPWVVNSGAWTRPADYASGAVIPKGRHITVLQGTLLGGTSWYTQASSITVDTTSTSWARTTWTGSQFDTKVATTAVRLTTLANKGALISATGLGAAATQAVGANGNALVADSTTSTGLRYMALMGCMAWPVSGQYSTVGGNTSTAVPTKDQELAFPIVFAEVPGNAVAIGFNVTVVGAASSVVRLGIRNDSGAANPYPGSVLLDAGTVATSSGTGWKEIVINQALTPGVIYWLTATVQTATGPTTTTTNATSYSLAGPSSVMTAALAGYAQTGVTGALGSFSSTVSVAFTLPRIALKF